MKTLLKILLLSTSLYSCNSIGENNSVDEKSDSSNVMMPPDSVSKNNNGAANFPDPSNLENETARKITEALLSSKQEITLLRAEVSDSLTRSDLDPQKRSLFSKTIRQLEASADLVNKQLEEILVGDLKDSREKLGEIVKKMKGSEKELGAMIEKLDKITGYMQVAGTLMQSLLPVQATPVSSKSAK